MPCCVAIGCHVREADKTVSPPITFHQFPTDQELRKKWVQIVRRENWEPNNRSRLCSKHFKEEDFDRSPFYSKLKKGVVPSRFEIFQERSPIKRYVPPMKDIWPPSKNTLNSMLYNQNNVVNDLNDLVSSTSQQSVRIHEDDNEKSGSEDQSTSDRFIIQPNTSVSQSSTAFQPPEKRTRMTFDIVRKSNHQQNRDEDEFSTMGKHIANKLRKLSSEVLPVVEKLITDVIFEAQCGSVSQTSRIAFYDMMNANLRNLQQTNLANKTPQENDTAMKSENQSSMSPNVVFLLPQSDVSKTLPLNVQVVQAKAEVQNRIGEQFPQANDQQANQRMIIN